MPPIGNMGSENQPQSSIRNTSLETEVPGPYAQLLVITVGLPATGKSEACRRIARRLNWLGYKTAVVTAADEPNNKQTVAFEVIQRLQEHFSVVIVDGCNGNMITRRYYKEKCARIGARMLFLHFLCSDSNILNYNMTEILKFRCDHRSREVALGEMRQYIQDYEEMYEPVTPEEGRLIQIEASIEGPVVLTKNIIGTREKEILAIVSSQIPSERTYYFTRHGESEYNLLGRIGGNSGLSERGQRYAERLGKFAAGLMGPLQAVWTSKMRRTIRTAKPIQATQHRLRALNEINAGACEGMTYEQIQDKYPQEFAKRDQDKLNYRYPGGESYMDIVARVTPLLEELETLDNILIVSHQAVLRVLLGYFLDTTKSKLPYQSVPLHTVIKITNHGYDYSAEFLPLNVDCVDTNRKQPKNCSLNRTSDDALNTVPTHETSGIRSNGRIFGFKI